MSWPLIALKDLVDINIGRTPSRDNADYWGSGTPWLSIRDMNQGKVFLKTAEQITALALEDTKIRVAEKGTVLFSFKLSIGKVGIAGLDMCHNEAIASMPIKQGVDLCKEYLYFALKQLDSSKDTDRAVMGATLNKKKMAELKIPLPPLETQKQIAAVLEKADQLRKDCQQMEQELNSLAQSVFIDMFVGKDFPLVNLEDLASNKKHALSSGPFGSALSSKHYTDEGVLVLRGLNTTKGKIDLSKTKYISQEKFQELKRSKLNVDDVVVVAVGSSGFAISIPDGFPEAVMSQNFNKISPNIDLIIPKYLEFAINSSFVQRQFSREITDTVRTFLSLTKLKKVQIPLPPLELQKEFLSTINSILKEEDLNQKLLSEIDNCFSSLMQKAFKGELNL